jgi:hypothetical protein
LWLRKLFSTFDLCKPFWTTPFDLNLIFLWLVGFQHINYFFYRWHKSITFKSGYRKLKCQCFRKSWVIFWSIYYKLIRKYIVVMFDFYLQAISKLKIVA